MRRSATFERLWSQVEAGRISPRALAEDLRVPAEMRSAVRAADALQRLGATAGADVDFERLWDRVASGLDRTVVPFSVRSAVRRRHWALRATAVAAAIALGVAVISLRAKPGSTLYGVRTSLERAALFVSPRDGGLRLRIAEARLHDLIEVLEHGPHDRAPGVARALTAARASAAAAGADVSLLDAAIGSQVPVALVGVPAGLAEQVRAILGSLVPPEPQPSFPLGPGVGRSGSDGSDTRGSGSSRSSGDSREGSQDQGASGSEGGGSSGSDGGNDGGGEPSPSPEPDQTPSPSPSD